MGREAALVSAERRMRGRVVDMVKKKMLLGAAWRKRISTANT
jgi:hypothetical protein